jgi:uncharacterized Ntn-hydrolase superfamily protein
MTYSIIARDPETGEFGGAVQSHYFSAGNGVIWAEAGVGAVATQSMVEVSYGPLGLDLMRAERTAEESLRGLIAADAGQARRQVAMVDAAGRTSAHTGASCIAFAGHLTAQNVSVQANMMERDTVPAAMMAAYDSASGDLAERLLAALDAAEAEGGDIRGRQAAGILTVAATSSGKSWADRRFDLRVEDHPEPLIELRRLVTLQRSYHLADQAEHAASKGDMATAASRMTEAIQLAEGNPEIAFWAAIATAASQPEAARRLLKRATDVDPRWAELVRRLPATGLYPLSDETIALLLGERS